MTMFLQSLRQDLRYAVRAMRASPGFTAVAVATLALGIGANAAIFSVVDGVLLSPLGYEEPDRLVRIFHEAPEEELAVSRGAFSPQDFEDLASASSAYEQLAAWYFMPGQSNATLLGGGEPVEVETAFVSPGFFATLGTRARLGRFPTAGENVPGADRVAVLGAGFWQRRFGADPQVVGREITLDGEAFTVIGVMPASFDFPSPEAELWVPLSLIGEDDIPHRRSLRWMSVIGRLAPGVAAETADAETNGILRGLAAQYPETNAGWEGATVVPLSESLVGDLRPALLLLLTAVGLVLLIACANLASLLLARGNARARELAVRAALGADRGRVLRQLLTESVVLAVAGGALGLALAYAGLDLLLALSAGTIPRPEAIGLDARVIAFALALSLLTGIAFGLVPSLSASKRSLRSALGEGARGAGAGPRSRNVRGMLVVGQTALAVMLLIGSGLLIRSLWNLTHVDPGFSRSNVLAVSVSTPPEVLQGGRRDLYRREVIAAIESVPGVLAVGGSKTVPLHGGGEPYAFNVPGRAEAITPDSGVLIVTPGYFRALGIPLLRGREFTAADETDGAQVIVVNRALARRYLSGDAVGESLTIAGQPLRIVGVVADVRHEGIAAEAAPAVYAPAHLLPRSSLKLFIRTAADPHAVVAAVRAAIHSVNPNQPVSDVTTMQQVVSETVARPRFFTLLLGGFAGMAVVLTAIGIYGVLAFTVSQRRNEIGIRIALGARAGDVLRLVIGQGMAPALLGLAIGLAAALALTRLLASLLFGVSAADPVTFGGAGLLIVAVAAFAAWLPAQRAVRVNPTSALRTE